MAATAADLIGLRTINALVDITNFMTYDPPVPCTCSTLQR